MPVVKRPVRCHLCHQQMAYSQDARHVPEVWVEVRGEHEEDRSDFYAHTSCWNELFGSDTPNKEQLAILDVINALRAVVAALHHWQSGDQQLSTNDAKTLLNLLADAEAKLKLP